MDLEQLLKNRNANSEIYLSDINSWLGDKVYSNLSCYDKYKLQKDLTNLSNGKIYLGYRNKKMG